MSIKFRCSQCNIKLSIKSSKAGSKIECPKCACRQVVPEESIPELATVGKSAKSQKQGKQDSSHSQPDDLVDDIEENENDEVRVFEEFAVYDEPDLVYDNKEYRTSTKLNVDYDRLAVPRYIIYLQGAMLGLASLFFFSLGWWMGSAGSVNRANVATQECVVSGNIYYQSSDGNKIDEGAVVMFLPAESRPMRKPDADDLLPGKVLTSQNNSAQIIRNLGGNIGSVSGTGKFELKLDTNKKYYLCVLSKNKATPEGEPSIQVRAEASAYFQPIDSLIKKQNFHWETIQISGRKKKLSDIVF